MKNAIREIGQILVFLLGVVVALQALFVLISFVLGWGAASFGVGAWMAVTKVLGINIPPSMGWITGGMVMMALLFVAGAGWIVWKELASRSKRRQ